ncbi:hypothetical protein WG66_007282, partial [Moniliophthora roreri]
MVNIGGCDSGISTPKWAPSPSYSHDTTLKRIRKQLVHCILDVLLFAPFIPFLSLHPRWIIGFSFTDPLHSFYLFPSLIMWGPDALLYGREECVACGAPPQCTCPDPTMECTLIAIKSCQTCYETRCDPPQSSPRTGSTTSTTMTNPTSVALTRIDVGLKPGAMAGVVITTALAVIALLLLTVYCVRRGRRRSAAPSVFREVHRYRVKPEGARELDLRFPDGELLAKEYITTKCYQSLSGSAQHSKMLTGIQAVGLFIGVAPLIQDTNQLQMQDILCKCPDYSLTPSTNGSPRCWFSTGRARCRYFQNLRSRLSGEELFRSIGSDHILIMMFGMWDVRCGRRLGIGCALVALDAEENLYSCLHRFKGVTSINHSSLLGTLLLFV